jgi:hypothetical protein
MAYQNSAGPYTARLAQRLNVRIKGSLRETGSGKFDIDVLDMSVSGCRVETSFVLSLGKRVWITFPGLSSIEAEIAWRRDFRYGCRFMAPLHAAVLDHIVARHRAAD